MHARDGSLFKFKSSQTLEKQECDNIIYFNCFKPNDPASECCFLMISIKESSKIVLQLFNQCFDGEYTASCRRSVDLMMTEDQMKTLENELNLSSVMQDFEFEAEMVINIPDDYSTTEFLSCFLNCDIKNDGIREILLISMNDRLFFIKYRGNFNDEITKEEMDEISIQPILIARGKIKAIKYFTRGFLMIIDGFWMLTIYYQCELTQTIKKKEISLIGEVTCFRFTNDHLIYSNRQKIVFMKFSLPSLEPKIFEVNLSMIATFTVIDNYKFLFAIDRNKFSYFVPLRPPMFIHDRYKKPVDEDYAEITNYDMLTIPRVVRYLKVVEIEFKELSNKIKYERNLSLFLDLLKDKKDFIAGSASIEFIPYLPKSNNDDDIVCKTTNQNSGHSYMVISMKLEAILKSFTFTIAFYRYTQHKGVLVRNIDICEKNKTEFAIFVPCEAEDNPPNQMELFVHFNFNSTDDKHVLQFPINPPEVRVSEHYQPIKNSEIDDGVRTLRDLMKKNNV